MQSDFAASQYWLLLLVPAVVAIGWLYFRRVAHVRQPQRNLIARPLLIYLAIQILLTLLIALRYKFDIETVARLATLPVTMAAQIALIVAALAWTRLWRPEILNADITSDQVDHLDPDRLRKIFKSDDFLTALNEALPKGTSDSEYGLDYVPYILRSVRRRRDRFDVSSRRFLRLTLALGVVSAAVVGAFGWALLDEVAVGAPRALRDVRNAVRTRQGTTFTTRRTGAVECCSSIRHEKRAV